MNEVVLDASAILALLNAEPGGEVVEQTLPGAIISTVNLSEIVAKLAERGMPEAVIRVALGEIGLQVIPFEEDLSYQTGMLRVSTRSAGLSFGDRACLALGRQMNLPVLTTDRNWASMDVGVEVRVIR
ncbi:MAG TPA: type II toxin-antitoxin system VapC family toxin [Thermoanaerobaculia bacterium]|jgi:PIN domain nuclease of toxin-antitoxin system|nr:type II toxin-antitoxin system VapC family toxin [Thermoanaerobaculia bacterium]